MIYDQTPLYIRKEDNTQFTNSEINVYNPSGDANSLIFYNSNEDQKISIQYLDSELTRVSGNINSTLDELYAPNIYSGNNQNIQILIPKFRILRFYNLNGSRLLDPLNLPNYFPDLYPYGTGVNSIIYTGNSNSYSYTLEWFKTTDRYRISSPNRSPYPYVYFTGSGSGFTSGWYNSQTSTYTGIYCTGLAYPISGIYNAINDPTGIDSNGYRKSATYSNATGIVSVQYFGDNTGYAIPNGRLNLGNDFSYIPALNISIDSKSSSIGKRTVDSNIDQNAEFASNSPLQTDISFNSYINTDCSGALNKILNSTGNSSYTIKLNSNIYSGCYLNSYNIDIQPNKPATIAVNYISTKTPEINLNKSNIVSILSQKASTNLLLNSKTLSQSTWAYNNFGFPGSFVPADGTPLSFNYGNTTDPTGGKNALYFTSRFANETHAEYSIDNTQSYIYTGILGVGTQLTSLKSATNQDLAVSIKFTGLFIESQYGNIVNPYFLNMYDQVCDEVVINNNGLLFLGQNISYEYDITNPYFTNYTNQNFPITNINYYVNTIAAYWKDLGSSIGSIWYQELPDRFIVEYNSIAGIPGNSSPTQTFQVHFIFPTLIEVGNMTSFVDAPYPIEIRYKNVSRSAVFNPNPNIGIQNQDASKYINYNLSNIDLTKSLRFMYTAVPNNNYTNIMYSVKMDTVDTRTFSIYLKRISANGLINYTLDGGANWVAINGVTTSWKRFIFPSNNDAQQIGIQIPILGDKIAIYGPQLEPLTYATDYMETTTSTVSRSDSYIDIDLNNFKSDNLKPTFVNNMVNGNDCSISTTAAVMSNIQTSIKYSVNSNKTPVYSLGQINPVDFLLDSVEKQMDISSTNLASFIDFSGNKLFDDLSLTLKNNSNVISSILKMSSGSYVTSEQMSIQEGDTLITQASIKEVIV
jgi:hypothetical protein